MLCMIFVVAIGRQNTVLALRGKLLPYSLRNAPAGSLTAVLYPEESYRLHLLPFLKNRINCSDEYPLDLALQDYIDEKYSYEESFYVEGEFFDHVGHFSSLGGTKKLNPIMQL